MQPIQGFAPIAPIKPIVPISTDEVSEKSGGFSALLNEAIVAINTTGEQSITDGISIMTGEADAPHNVVISSEESRIVLEYTLAVRTKILDAYNEVMRMQI